MTVLLIVFLVCIALTVLLDAQVEPVSRRFANLSFVLWMVKESSQHDLVSSLVTFVLFCCFLCRQLWLGWSQPHYL